MPSYKNCLTGSESTIQPYPDLSIDAKTAISFLQSSEPNGIAGSTTNQGHNSLLIVPHVSFT
jgi:hypothetical protein